MQPQPRRDSCRLAESFRNGKNTVYRAQKKTVHRTGGARGADGAVHGAEDQEDGGPPGGPRRPGRPGTAASQPCTRCARAADCSDVSNVLLDCRSTGAAVTGAHAEPMLLLLHCVYSSNQRPESVGERCPRGRHRWRSTGRRRTRLRSTGRRKQRAKRLLPPLHRRHRCRCTSASKISACNIRVDTPGSEAQQDPVALARCGLNFSVSTACLRIACRAGCSEGRAAAAGGRPICLMACQPDR